MIVKQATCLSVCLSVQELQCDVSVEEDSRQEWTFTLYDFDNNGKVTREVSVLSARWQPSGTGLGLDLSLLPLLLPGGGRARQGLVAKGCWECPGPSVSAAEAEWVQLGTSHSLGLGVPLWGEVGDSGKVQGLPREEPWISAVFPCCLFHTVPKL